MKRALALLAVCSLFGFGVWAQSFTGSWDATIKWDFAKSAFALSSDVSINYAVAGWTFGSVSSFGDIGYISQEFTAVGSFGAINFDSTVTFLPSALTSTVWALKSPYDTQTFSSSALTTCILSSTKVYTGPFFKDWKTTATLTFGGVDLEVLFYLNGWDNYASVTYPIVEEIQTGVYQLDGSLAVYTEKPVGSGWRVKLSGTVNGMTLTSYTYFNILEYDAQVLNLDPCPVLGKSGVYKLASESCAGGFYEEYFMIEGISFACVTVDMAVKFRCDGVSTKWTCDDTTGEWTETETELDFFGGAEFLVKDIPFLPWVNLTAYVKFTTEDKLFSLCGTIPTLGDCITINADLQWEEEDSHNNIANKIGGLYIKDMTFTWEISDCSSITVTEVFWKLTDEDYGNYLKKIADPDEKTFLLDIGKRCWDPDTEADEYTEYVVYCMPEAYYYGWESVELSLCGPGCCGGEYEVNVTTIFGKGYEVIGGTPTIKYTEDKATGFSVTPILGDEIDLATLFDWLETEVAATIPLSSDFSLSTGFGVSFLGWEYFEIGISFTF